MGENPAHERLMHILNICPHYLPAYHFGGALRVAHALGKALAARGHEVRVCTTNLKDPWKDLETPVDSPVLLDKIQVFYEPVKFSRYWGFSPALVRRIWRESAWADVVLIHFHYQFASLVGSWISRWRGKPYIIFSHGSLNKFGITSGNGVRKRLYLHFLERQNLRQASFVAYHSAEEMETSYRFGRCRVVPNGIDPGSFRERPQVNFFRQKHSELQDKVIFLFLGRLDAGKGLDLLLPAFKRVTTQLDKVHLVLAGGNEKGYETQVRRLVEELGLSRRVTLTGLITGREKLGALQDADVFVLPSRSEGLSMAMLEAMYMGLPPLVTDRVGLWRQIQEQACGVVAPLDVDYWAAALKHLAQSPEREHMGHRAQELVLAHYTWDTIAGEFETQIQMCVNESSLRFPGTSNQFLEDPGRLALDSSQSHSEARRQTWKFLKD